MAVQDLKEGRNGGAGRVAVVTGASAGIGAGLAAMLAAEGAKVVLAARRERELAGVADGIRQRGGVAIPVVADLTSDESIARLLATAEAGPVDVLVNNAGYAAWKPLEETASAEWVHIFAVNVRAAACLSAAVLPGMQARRFGRIINIGSEAGVAIVPGLENVLPRFHHPRRTGVQRQADRLPG
jgi:short-subunit dehydrogenase